MHPLLVELQDARGPAFLTCGHVLDVLDANDPDALVRSWMAGTPTARMNGVGLLVRSCAWQEDDEPCDRPVRTVNAKFCEAHAAASARGSKRAWKRARGRKSNPSPALGNHGVANGPDPLPGIQVFPDAQTPEILVLEGA